MNGSQIERAWRSVEPAGAIPGVVVGATDRDGPVLLRAFGLADARRQLAMPENAVFRIASMTKLVTSIAVLQLVEEGRVDLDAPFGRYFTGFRQPPVLRAFDAVSGAYETAPANRDISVRDLLTHTAGYGAWFLNPELRSVLGAKPEYYNPPFLMHPPGTRLQYGISSDILGQLVLPMSGLPLEDYFTQRILGPLGMRDTAFAVPADAKRLVPVHVPVAAGLAPLPNERAPPEAPRGGAGLYATAQDYLSLLRMLLNGGAAGDRRILAADSVTALSSNQIGVLPAVRQTTAAPERTADFTFMDGTQKFGFNVLVETRARAGGRAAGSFGWAGIFNTYFWVDPTAGIAAVVMMQTTPFCAPPALALCAALETALYRELGLAR
jgi:methyl acetate hydrolase